VSSKTFAYSEYQFQLRKFNLCVHNKSNFFLLSFDMGEVPQISNILPEYKANFTQIERNPPKIFWGRNWTAQIIITVHSEFQNLLSYPAQHIFENQNKIAIIEIFNFHWPRCHRPLNQLSTKAQIHFSSSERNFLSISYRVPSWPKIEISRLSFESGAGHSLITKSNLN
jgi:hypothetical protein